MREEGKERERKEMERKERGWMTLQI